MTKSELEEIRKSIPKIVQISNLEAAYIKIKILENEDRTNFVLNTKELHHEDTQRTRRVYD